MGASICWTAKKADTQFTIFDLSALKKQCLISAMTEKVFFGDFPFSHYLSAARITSGKRCQNEMSEMSV